MNIPLSADVRMQEIKRILSYQNTKVLTVTIHYPVIWLQTNKTVQAKINTYFRSQANAYLQHCLNTLYPEAIQEYKDSIANNFPFRPYEAFMQYEVTYNYNCHFSTYHDQYEYTGGAHGNTIRLSDTWNIKTGQMLPLSSLFRPETDYRELLIGKIVQQANKDHANYFDNYEELIIQYFNPNSYFLSPSGLNIYYQQYEIAPYVTGIVVFTIPYSEIAWRPSCI